mmetsp:Transcript_89505/g.289485  ORF Transcript_89505/g.289485 Transcript_89505/m.289485 type:complete len:210 (-) Transcript_89505:941-1570(-)
MFLAMWPLNSRSSPVLVNVRMSRCLSSSAACSRNISSPCSSGDFTREHNQRPPVRSLVSLVMEQPSRYMARTSWSMDSSVTGKCTADEEPPSRVRPSTPLALLVPRLWLKTLSAAAAAARPALPLAPGPVWRRPKVGGDDDPRLLAEWADELIRAKAVALPMPTDGPQELPTGAEAAAEPTETERQKSKSAFGGPSSAIVSIAAADMPV